MSIKLHGYWRSTATYRVRIALNLKGVDYEYVPVHLVANGGEQHSMDYARLNPAHLVPTFVDEDEDIILNQSLAIIEYLDERYASDFRLIPEHKTERARVDVSVWAAHWITLGFDAIEKRLQTQSGKYCFDFDVTMADICLVPQVYNAKRFNIDMDQYPLISKIADNCNALEAFEKAKPENQIDAS